MKRIIFAALLLAVSVPMFSQAAGAATPLARRSQLGVAVNFGPDGPTVTAVTDTGAAGALGLRVGDRISDINGVSLRNTDDMDKLSRLVRAGDQVTLNVVRGGQGMQLHGTLAGVPLENFPGVTTVYDSAQTADGYRVRIILTHPVKSKGRLPVAFLTGWLSCDVPEYPSGKLDGFGQVLHDVAVNSGYALVRVEKPGSGDSEGPNCSSADFNAELGAYRAAFAALSKYDFIDSKRIVMLGMSNGAGFAPLVAGDTPVLGYVAMGGWGRTWYEHMIDLERRRLAFTGKNPGEVTQAMPGFEQFYTDFLIRGMQPADAVKAQPGFASQWYDAPDGQYGRPAAFYQQLQALNLGGAWEKVSVPVLVLAGEYDWIMSRADQEAIALAANTYHAGRATFTLLDKTDHGLYSYANPAAAFKGDKGKFNTTASKLVLKFLKKLR